jgi:hypothetical protein
MIHRSPAAAFYKGIYLLVGFVCLLTIALVFLFRFLGSGPFWSVWEDSFMLARYANNLIHGSGLIWNPGGAPTYGLTSVFYVGPVALVQAILPHHPVFTLPLTSFLCGCLFSTLAAFLLRPILRASRAAQGTFGILIAISFARASTPLATHFLDGMDTMFDLSMLTGYLLIARWLERRNTWAAAIAMGAAGGLMFDVRPDLLIFTFLIPAFILLLGKDRATKIKGAAVLFITGGVTAIVLLTADRYFGSALPLSFYAKGLKLYGDFEYDRGVPFKQFLDYFSSYFLLFGVILADLFQSVRSREKTHRSPLEIALLCGTLLFCLYYLFFVVQIMEFNSRFYYPTLAGLLFLSAVSTVRVVDRSTPWAAKIFAGANGRKWAAGLGALAILLVAPALVLNAYHVLKTAKQGFVGWDLTEEYKTYWGDYWFRLDRFSALPSDLVMATTEIGHVGAMNLDKTVVDLAGLNETQFAKKPFSASVLLSQYAPDLIYMPHPGYRSMNRDLRENPKFIQEYELIPASALGPAFKMGVALRRSSKYYAQMHRIMTAPN